MFTGLVKDLGTIEALEQSEQGARLTVSAPLCAALRDGDSISVNGVCLTAASVSDHRFTADVMNETLRRSALGAATKGSRVNLELPLRADDRLGGHVVQGHVDGLGEVSEVVEDGIARRIKVTAPA